MTVGLGIFDIFFRLSDGRIRASHGVQFRVWRQIDFTGSVYLPNETWPEANFLSYWSGQETAGAVSICGEIVKEGL